MSKKVLSLLLVSALSLAVVGCSGAEEATKDAVDNAEKAATEVVEQTEKAATEAVEQASTAVEEAATPEAPGESGFVEIQIGEEQQVGPYNVAAVYFQAVDMIPAGKNPSREESDMHLEADIHLQSESAAMYGFGSGDNIWPAYLTVKYEVMDKDGNLVTEGSFMPMNADDGPHYGTNIKKDIMTVGQYKLKLIIEPPTDYLLHVDDTTGVPAKQEAAKFFETQTVEYDWNYTGEQLQNE